MIGFPWYCETLVRAGAALSRRKCLYPKRVNVRLEQAAQRSMDHSVPLYATLAVKSLRHDRDIEMALAISRALMACVQMTLIFKQ